MTNFNNYYFDHLGPQTTTQAIQTFVDGLISGKKVTDVPGIGPVFGEKLTKAGYATAEKLLGQFLVLERNEDNFIKWMKDICGTDSVNRAHYTKTFKALNDWSNQHL